MKTADISDLQVGNERPLTLIAGPCHLESADHAQLIFKGSFDKANRTSLSCQRRLGIVAVVIKRMSLLTPRPRTGRTRFS